MRTIRTPDENYFTGGYVKFSTSRKDGELYYQITLYNGKNQLYCAEKGKVKDEAHIKKLQEMSVACNECLAKQNMEKIYA